MSSLAVWSICLGAFKLLFSAFGFAAPAKAMTGLRAFPRSKWPARVLSTVDLVWAAILLNEMPMGAFDSWKVALYALCPLAIILVPLYLDELLAPRALGGLYLLIASPILAAARWHPSDLSVILSFLSYLIICIGIALVLAPYLLGRFIRFATDGAARFKVMSAAGLLGGGALVLLGIFAY